MSERATCWSITINNPVVADYQIPLPVGWKLEGQLERGEQGTEHYQGMLRTPQARFSAIKKVFPRAHIEVAKNAAALKKYVHKEDTRVAEVANNITIWEYQTIIAKKWVEDEYQNWVKIYTKKNKIPDFDEIAMRYLDSLVARDIESGRRCAEFIAINPMWRASWKHFWRSIIKRDGQSSEASDEEAGTPAPQGCSEQEDGGSGVCISEADDSGE